MDKQILWLLMVSSLLKITILLETSQSHSLWLTIIQRQAAQHHLTYQSYKSNTEVKVTSTFINYFLCKLTFRKHINKKLHISFLE